MSKFVTSFIKQCVPCQRVKLRHKKTPIQANKTPYELFHYIINLQLQSPRRFGPIRLAAPMNTITDHRRKFESELFHSLVRRSGRKMIHTTW